MDQKAAIVETGKGIESNCGSHIMRWDGDLNWGRGDAEGEEQASVFYLWVVKGASQLCLKQGGALVGLLALPWQPQKHDFLICTMYYSALYVVFCLKKGLPGWGVLLSGTACAWHV